MALKNLTNSNSRQKFIVDADELNQNFQYLFALIQAGGGIVFGLDEERGTPSGFQFYWATDSQTFYLFVNNTAVGSNGWITLGGA